MFTLRLETLYNCHLRMRSSGTTHFKATSNVQCMRPNLDFVQASPELPKLINLNGTFAMGRL